MNELGENLNQFATHDSDDYSEIFIQASKDWCGSCKIVLRSVIFMDVKTV